MAFSESTGQLILQAAQGLSRTIQVQKQMQARQAEREATMALEVSNLKAKNERDKLAAEKDKIALETAQLNKEKLERQSTPEALAKREDREAAELERIKAQTRKLSREEKDVGTATARKAAERFGLVSAVRDADQETVSFPRLKPDGETEIVNLSLSTVKPELLRLAQTGDVDTLRTERGRSQQLIAELQQAPAFAFGSKEDKAKISAQIVAEQQKVAMITYLQDTANKVAAGATPAQILSTTQNPSERAIVQDSLERENLSSKLSSVSGQSATKIDTAFDNNNGEYAEVVRMFSGTQDPTVLKTLAARAEQEGIPPKVVKSMIDRIFAGTNNTE